MEPLDSEDEEYEDDDDTDTREISDDVLRKVCRLMYTRVGRLLDFRF